MKLGNVCQGMEAYVKNWEGSLSHSVAIAPVKSG